MNQGFYDMHCHILPGVDDGAKDMETALRMLEMERNEGIRQVMLTPHFHVGHYEHTAEFFRERFSEFTARAAVRFPDMELHLGCEICYHYEAAERLEEGKLLTLADTDYVLLEFFPRSELRMIRQGVREIQMAGKLPVIAHAERYQALNSDFHAVEALVDAGSYIQVNTGSLMGKEGIRIRQFVKKLLKYELVHFFGTDAHGVERRRPQMRECTEYIARKWGRDYVEELFITNPQKLVWGVRV